MKILSVDSLWFTNLSGSYVQEDFKRDIILMQEETAKKKPPMKGGLYIIL